MNRSQKVVIFLFVASFLGGVISGASFYYHLAYFWGGLFLFAWIHSRLVLQGLDLNRISRIHRSQVGLNLEERFELINHSRIPHLWVAIKNDSPLPDSKGSKVIGLIKGNETRSYLVRTRLIQRGLFPLGDTILSSGDIFGLFQVQRRLPARDSILVFPMTVDIRDFPSPAGTLPGGEAMRRRTQQITANAAGVRDYLPGDPFNRIHWLSSARQNRLIVKEFELDPLAEVWMIFDADKQLHRGEARIQVQLNPRELWKRRVNIPMPSSSFEVQVVACASLIKYFLEKKRSVGFIARDRNLHLFSAEKGSRQFIKIMESLAIIEPEGSLPIQNLVENQAKFIPTGSTVILLSPATYESILQTTYILGRRGYHPLVIRIAAETYDPDAQLPIGLSPEQNFNFPVYIIHKGDELTQVLRKSVY